MKQETKNPTQVQLVFDAVLNTEYEEQLELTFPSQQAAESFRSALYRERKNYLTKTGIQEQITIARDYRETPVKLLLSRVPGIMTISVVKKDGSKEDVCLQEPFLPTESECPPVDTASQEEIERQKELMRADGVTEAEINSYFREEKDD